MPLVSPKLNLRLEYLKARIRGELGRPLTDHEEHLIELSAALLDSEEEAPEQAEGHSQSA